MAQSTKTQAKQPRITKKQLLTAGFGIIFLAAITVSGQHIYHVARHYGQMWTEAGLLPLILDVFGLFCAVRLRLPNISNIARVLARIGMWFSLGTSMAFNVESALIVNNSLNGANLVKAIVISTIPAIIVWITAEILTHTHRRPTPPAARTRKRPAAPSSAKITTPARTARQRKAPAAESLSETASVE